MPTRGVALVVQYVAWDTSGNSGKTGDSANHTLRWVKDGTSAAPSAPSITEIDSTNAPGLYKASISASEADCNIGTLCGKSSTSGVAIIPITIAFENGPEIADHILTRNWASVALSVPNRCLLNAARFLRNLWAISGSSLTVKKEDDSTEAFGGSLTVDGNGRITGFTPSA